MALKGLWGIGTDITDMRRIAAMMQRHGARFIQRLCHAEEWTTRWQTQNLNAVSDPVSVAWLAKRFAAKEAMIKALGTGFQAGLSWHDVRVVSDAWGKPWGALSPAAKNFVWHKAGAVMPLRMHLSLSDEPPYALAFAALICHPEPLPVEEAPHAHAAHSTSLHERIEDL